MPASEYRIELEAYAGPLDLLLYLVKRHEIDLHDIPIAQLTDQYLQHLGLIEQIDMEKAGEFLVMAATLLEIKSQMILPRPEQAEGEDGDGDDAGDTAGGGGGGDPRYELVQQLLAYKRYKDAARKLEHQHDEWHARHPAQARPAAKAKPEPGEGDDADDAAPRDIDLEDINLLDLCEAFSRLLDSIGQKREHEVTYDDTPISLHAADIFDRLEREGPMTLQAIFVGRTGRSEMIGLFLATLELVRERRVRVIQDKIAGEIRLEATGLTPDAAADDAPSDWRDPETGQMQYDWPDEQTRRRAERRANLREKWKAKGADEDESDLTEEDDAEVEDEPVAEAEHIEDDADDEPFDADDDDDLDDSGDR